MGGGGQKGGRRTKFRKRKLGLFRAESWAIAIASAKPRNKGGKKKKECRRSMEERSTKYQQKRLREWGQGGVAREKSPEGPINRSGSAAAHYKK